MTWKWSKWKFQHFVKSARSICCRSIPFAAPRTMAMHNRYWRWTQLPCVHFVHTITLAHTTIFFFFSSLHLFISKKCVKSMRMCETETRPTQARRMNKRSTLSKRFHWKTLLSECTNHCSICWRNGNPLAYGCDEFDNNEWFYIAKWRKNIR